MAAKRAKQNLSCAYTLGTQPTCVRAGRRRCIPLLLKLGFEVFRLSGGRPSGIRVFSEIYAVLDSKMSGFAVSASGISGFWGLGAQGFDLASLGLGFLRFRLCF